MENDEFEKIKYYQCERCKRPYGLIHFKELDSNEIKTYCEDCYGMHSKDLRNPEPVDLNRYINSKKWDENYQKYLQKRDTEVKIELEDFFYENRELVQYKHYLKRKADKRIKKAENKRYIVKTINLTYATENNEKNYSKQHKNKYICTMEALELWGLFMYEVAEKVISIRRKIGIKWKPAFITLLSGDGAKKKLCSKCKGRLEFNVWAEKKDVKYNIYVCENCGKRFSIKASEDEEKWE